MANIGRTSHLKEVDTLSSVMPREQHQRLVLCGVLLVNKQQRHALYEAVEEVTRLRF
jgi:hypothetical protein